MYHAQQPFPVYAIDEWWSDAWDAVNFGREWQSDRDFFPQFAELSAAVPRMASYNRNCENSEYSSYAGNSKNAYYSDVCFRSENIFYSDTITGKCERIVDSLACFRSSDLGECILCRNVRDSVYVMRAADCRNCYFSYDLKGCHDCLFCSNLRNKQYYVRNKAVSREEFQSLRAEVFSGSADALGQAVAEWHAVTAQAAHLHLEMANCEACVGDELHNCHHCSNCFFCSNTNGAKHCLELAPSETNLDSLDVTVAGVGELLFNSVILGGGNYFLRMCVNCRESVNLTYCMDCFLCRDCFGCIGLRNKQHCVLNRQYSAETFATAVDNIISRMKSDGKWGRFFPPALSPFAYNESVAQRFFPLTEQEAKKIGYRWRADDRLTSGSSRPFRILPQELELRGKLGLPPPREHPELRMQRRRQMLNLFALRAESCQHCQAPLRTANVKQPVLCGACYSKAMHN